MKFIENRLYRATIKGCCHSDSVERETKLIYKREVECEVGSYYVSSYLFERYDGTFEIISEVDGKFFYLVGCRVELVDIAKENEEAMIEKLADLEHEQWAHWTKYMLDTLDSVFGLLVSEFRIQNREHPEIQKAQEVMDRWRRQIETPYSDLSEKEKESDRKWARKVINIVKEK